MKRKILFVIFCFILGFVFCQEDLHGTYTGKDPNDFMGSDELKIIVKTGNEEQSQTAANILAERERIKRLEKEIDDKLAEINKILAQTKGAGVSRKIINEYLDLKNKLIAAKQKETDLLKKAKQLAEDALNNQKAQKSGDPVNITTGSYEQTETDLVLNIGSEFEIKRRYDSANKIESSLGYGWYYTLDERIILGTAPNAAAVYDTMQTNIEDLKQIIENLKKEIVSGYQLLNLEGAVEEIEERINKCLPIKERAEELVKEKKVEYKARPLLNAAEKKLEDLDYIKEKLEEDIAEIPELELKLEEAEKEANDYNSDVLQPSLSRKKKNRYAFFEGMDNFSEETGLDTVTIIDSNGYPHLLIWNEEGQIWNKEGERTIRKCRSISPGYEVTYTDGLVKLFDEAGLLIKVTYRNGNYITINRNEQEKINYIESSFGEKYNFRYTGKFISKITNNRAADESLVYEYKGNKLSSIRDTDGDTVSLEYNADGKMECLKKCDGSLVKIEYDQQDSQGNLLATATINEENFAEKFEYYPSDLRAEYTDHDGNKTIYSYDEKHRTKKEKRPDGTIIINEYDTDGNLWKQTENGNTVTYGYDEKGNKTSAVYSDNTAEYWTYNTYNQLISYKDRSGVKTEYKPDSKGNIKKIFLDETLVCEQDFRPDGLLLKRTVHGQKDIVTRYDYDEYGNLKSEESGGVKTEYIYDKRNRLKKILVAGKLITEYEYDGHKTIQKDYNGLETTYHTNGRKDLVKLSQKDTQTGQIHESRIEYDKRHLPLKVYAGDGKNERLISSYLYTPEGKIKAELTHGKEVWIKLYEYEKGQISEVKQFMIKDAASVKALEGKVTEQTLKNLLKKAGGNVFTQKYSYEIKKENRKFITITDGLGNVSLFEYDSFGNLKKTTDGSGEVRQKVYEKGYLKKEQGTYGGWYEYEYEKGRMIKAREQGSSLAVQTKYNADGSVSSQTDRYGKVTYYNYDSRGRVSSIQSELQKIWYEYDSLDRVTKEVIGKTSDVSGSLYYVTYDYSEDGRSVTVTEGGKYKKVSLMDAFGNLVKEIDGNANERSYVYDYLNQLIQSSDGYGNKTFYEYNALGAVSRVTMSEGETTDYQYNYMRLLEKITDECGTVYAASYDKAGCLEKERNRADSEKTYKYDNSGRVSEVWCGGELIEAYEYENNSRKVTVKDGKENTYLYNYDAFGRLKNEKNRLGLTQTYSYDQEGQLKGQTGFDGTQTTISYSADRSIRTVSYSDGSENRFACDAMGNLVVAENAYGKTTYCYDQGGRLVYQKDITTGEEISFEYDAAGNRTRLYSTNRETKYSYGKNNEVKEIFDNKQRISIKLDYNKNGSEVLRKFGNGTEEITLYDKAGRVSVKLQKDGLNQLLWGEGYVYGSDGKRTATVDNTGRVTLYEYNKKGQLETVYYPYTVEMENSLKIEAQTNGLPVNTDIGENRFLTSEEKSKLVVLMNSMQYGLAYNLLNLHVVIKESYEYDKNGNRSAKITPFGKIEYTYDNENCLLSSGSRGQPYVSYTYDKAGNLLSEESASKSVKYAYNSQNRLIYCEVTDRSESLYTQTAYAYDAFGRRILVKDNGEAALRILYDGLTFDIIKQSPTFENGLFTDSYDTGIKYGKTGRPTGDRYRYLDDESTKDGSRYFYLQDGTYQSSSTRYRGERTAVTVNGTIAAQATSDYGTDYFVTDLLGSVTGITDSRGSQKTSYTYDAFGTLIQGDLTGTSDYGYLGKQSDPTTALYNYGYRDYKPQTARFTTVDPIRDGSNWFLYCNGDPVNFVDLRGLLTSDNDYQNTKKRRNQPVGTIMFDSSKNPYAYPETYEEWAENVKDFWIDQAKKTDLIPNGHTQVLVIRPNEGYGNEFDSMRVAIKKTAKGDIEVLTQMIGANAASLQFAKDNNGMTRPDGDYYYTTSEPKGRPKSWALWENSNGYNSNSYENVLREATDDYRIPVKTRYAINSEMFLSHANQKRNSSVKYSDGNTPWGAGCAIANGQDAQDEYMKFINYHVNASGYVDNVKIKYISGVY